MLYMICQNISGGHCLSLCDLLRVKKRKTKVPHVLDDRVDDTTAFPLFVPA